MNSKTLRTSLLATLVLGSACSEPPESPRVTAKNGASYGQSAQKDTDASNSAADETADSGDSSATPILQSPSPASTIPNTVTPASAKPVATNPTPEGSTPTPVGSIPTPAETTSGSAPLPAPPQEPVALTGEEIFTGTCVGCHSTSRVGNPSANDLLTKIKNKNPHNNFSEWLTSEEAGLVAAYLSAN